MAPLSKLIFSKRKMPLLYKTKQNKTTMKNGDLITAED